MPGLPTNPVAAPSVQNCNEVRFNWNPPPEDEQNGTHIYLIEFSFNHRDILAGIIRHYRLRVTPVGGGLSGGTFIIPANTTSIVLTTLTCCISYTYSLSAFTISYGPSTTRNQFQTYPDLSS